MAIYKIGTKYRDIEFSVQWAHGPTDEPGADLNEQKTEDEKLFDEEIDAALAQLERIRKKLSG